MQPRVHRVRDVELPVNPAPLRFVSEHAAAIAEHWAEERRARPNLFNGLVHMATEVRFGDGTMTASCHGITFDALLYWRKNRTVTCARSIFGTVILRCADNGLILGRMAQSNATGGVVCFPSGALDENDVSGDRLDPTACILRECEEETGLSLDRSALRDGYLIYEDERRVAVSRIADLPWSSAEALARITNCLAAQEAPELDHVMVAHSNADLTALEAETAAYHMGSWIFHQMAES